MKNILNKKINNYFTGYLQLYEKTWYHNMMYNSKKINPQLYGYNIKYYDFTPNINKRKYSDSRWTV